MQEGGAPKTWLFSYGSNNLDQLKRRLKRTGEFTFAPGVLLDHARIFAGYSRRWEGGVASVLPKKNTKVYGTLVEVTAVELDALDSFEGGYHREIKDVHTPDGYVVPAVVYVKDNPMYSHPPSIAYLQAILKTLHDPPRRHSSRILIRIFDQSQKIKTTGVWTTQDGIVLRK